MSGYGRRPSRPRAERARQQAHTAQIVQRQDKSKMFGSAPVKGAMPRKVNRG